MIQKNRKAASNGVQETVSDEMLKAIREFRFINDEFMTAAFSNNKKAVELMLQIILEKPDLVVTEARTQSELKNLYGRSLRLDIDAKDSSQKQYNIEIQKAREGAGAKRARYHSSLLDSNSLPAGYDIRELVETYVIFITQSDVLAGNRSIYHIDRYVKETGESFCDEAHIIYVNASYKDGTALGMLMHDFLVTDPNEVNYQILVETMRFYKESEEGIKAMSEIMKKMTDSAREEGREEGILGAIAILRDLLTPENKILQMVQEKYFLTLAEAQKYLARFTQI